MPYRLSTLAEQDLDGIWSYVADDASPETADRLIDDIVDPFDLLAESPGMGRARPEFGIGVRSFAVENYIIYYRQEDDVLIAGFFMEDAIRSRPGRSQAEISNESQPPPHIGEIRLLEHG